MDINTSANTYNVGINTGVNNSNVNISTDVNNREKMWLEVSMIINTHTKSIYQHQWYVVNGILIIDTNKMKEKRLSTPLLNLNGDNDTGANNRIVDNNTVANNRNVINNNCASDSYYQHQGW